ncbi:Serine/threonine-protein phosphatase 6 regulatory ankyrin repeat subunit A-like isoform X1 [Oopsacas minuta]|uniref:Serine/threonine-protein phosphatase 6 regulatory ankyrin repeat subunit A-like isoform X1 n=1 Tax=Oopsacas minuta TaxID=111878 RepID=A0AAV7JZ15_9METZ|nr:Serine/threonine-protein phosphatase 6 regulatory ankyrin repeat subunit A-like isoform X1 [Oopsacas minuta]
MDMEMDTIIETGDDQPIQEKSPDHVNIGDGDCLIHINSSTESCDFKNSCEGLIAEDSIEVERHNRPTKIVLCQAENEEKGCPTPIKAHRHLLKNKVGITDDGQKRIVKLVRAFYYFPKAFSSFAQFEIVLAKLSSKQNLYTVYSLKNLEGEPVDVSRNKVVALTPNIWKYGVKNKQFVTTNFISDLINADRPELIELAYLQLPILDVYLPNPFNTSEKRKKPISRHEGVLHMCARNGSAHSMRYLLEITSPYFPLSLQSNLYSRGDSILQAAIESNSIQVVEIILNHITKAEEVVPEKNRQRGFTRGKRTISKDSNNQSMGSKIQIINQKNDYTETSLHVCLRKENLDCLNMLLRNNANISIEDKYGNSVVHTAALRNRDDALKEMLHTMLEKEEGLNEWQSVLKNCNKKRLIPAALATEIPVVEVLLERANKEGAYNDELGRLLFWAAGRNKLELARYLIGEGATVNVENENGQTPLKLACVRGHVDLAELILEHNEDPNYTGENSKLTAMNSAARSGHIDVVELLRRHNVHLWDQGVMETSALHSAIAGGQSQLAEFLIEQAMMNTNARDKCERTPLYYAIEEGHPDCVKVLLRNQADPELVVDGTGQKAVHLAVENDKRQILKILLDFGARPDEATQEGVTPLLLSIRKDYAHILQLLLLYNINIEREDEENNNLMHLIAINKSSKCANFLLKEQDNAKARHMILNLNYDDKTPINIARDNRSQEVLQLFIQYVPIDLFDKDPSIFHVLYNDKQYDILKVVFNRLSRPLEERPDLVSCNPSFLDSNEQGQNPYSKTFSHLLPSFMHKLIDCQDNELKEHPLVKIAVKNKLRVYRIWYLFTFLVFAVFLVSLTVSLILSSYDCETVVRFSFVEFDPNSNNYVFANQLRAIRFVCELIVFGYGINLFINELVEFVLVWSHRYKDKSVQYNRDRVHQPPKRSKDLINTDELIAENLRVLVNTSTVLDGVDRRFFYLPGAFITYFLDNIIDLSGILCLTLLVIFRYFRIGNVDVNQWTFAAFAFIIYTLTLFKYTKIIPSLGSYVETVRYVFIRDIPRFLVILGIVVFAFIGGIHLAARQPIPPSGFVNNSYTTTNILGGTDNCLVNEDFVNFTLTRLFWINNILTDTYDLRRPLLTGSFFILDSGAEEVQSDLLNVNFTFVLLYALFAFAIIVVLSNILIAQLSQTYAEFSKQNEFHYQLQLVLSIELESNISFFLGKYFRRYAFVRVVNVPYKEWVNLEDNSAGKDIERRISFIEENLQKSFKILSQESHKSSQRKDTLDAMGERLGDLGGKVDVVKSYLEDPVQLTLPRRRRFADASRTSMSESRSYSVSDSGKMEERINALDLKVTHIVELLEKLTN